MAGWNAKGQNLHEGAELVDMVGVFMMSGERTVFTTDEGSQRFIGLENLNLERIVRMLGESNSQTQWRLSGRVTEYRGSNYLLISRAVRSLSPNISRPVTDLSTGIGALGSGSPAP